MIAVVILIVLVTVLSVYSAFGTYQNTQDIKALASVTKVIGINAKHICKILEILKEHPQIVQCKDCSNKKCWERTGDVVCGIDGNSHEPDWFCAYGKRKEG